MNRTVRLPCTWLLGMLGICASAQAQHAPLIERMADPDPATTSATATDAPDTVADSRAAATRQRTYLPRSQVGDTTRSLLQLQADSGRPGNALPMLGEAASRSYQRYLDSFSHPIPEYFEAALPDPKQGGSSR